MARDTVMKKPKDTRGAVRRLLRYLGPWKYVIAGIVVLSLFGLQACSSSRRFGRW